MSAEKQSKVEIATSLKLLAMTLIATWYNAWLIFDFDNLIPDP